MSNIKGEGQAQKFIQDVLKSETDRCILWPFSKKPSGYGRFDVEGIKTTAHRYVCIQAHGTPEGDANEAAHSCGNRECVNPRHLRWATREENLSDRRHHGTHGFVLDEKQVLVILRDPRTQQEIADDFGIARATVGDIKTGRKWKHLHALVTVPPNNKAKITAEIAMKVFNDPRHYDEIAAEYGIHNNTVRDIKKKRRWKQIHD